MFSVLFEVYPKAEKWDDYLGYAKLLRPELEKVDGFVDNIRYRSLTREGWLLSVSGWRDEKALVRWRTQPIILRWLPAAATARIGIRSTSWSVRCIWPTTFSAWGLARCRSSVTNTLKRRSRTPSRWRRNVASG